MNSKDCLTVEDDAGALAGDALTLLGQGYAPDDADEARLAPPSRLPEPHRFVADPAPAQPVPSSTPLLDQVREPADLRRLPR